MFYFTQYFFSFLEAYTETTGTPPGRYRVSLARLNYGPAAVELLPGGQPITRSFEDGSDSIFTPILPSKVVLELICQEFWQIGSLDVDSDRELQCLIEYDPTGTGNTYTVDWVGWVIPQDLKEEYEDKPYRVSLTAVCGLSSLKTRPLLDANGFRLDGYPVLSTVIRTALLLCGTDAPMITAVNLFETQDIAAGQTANGKALPQRDPLNRIRQHAEGLLTDKNEALSAYDTLKKELEPFGCRVALINGAYWIVRVDEMAGGWDVWDSSNATIHTRTYPFPVATNDPDTHASVNLNLRTGKFFGNRVLSGGIVGRENPLPGVKVEQAFGAYQNKLGNGSFAQVDATGLPIGWHRKNVSDPNKAKRFGTGTDADPFRVRIYGSDYEGYIENQTVGIDQQFHYDTGSAAFLRNLKLTRTLKGRFRLFNARGAKIVIRCSFVQPPQNPWAILADGGVWIPNPKAAERKGILVLHDILANNVDHEKPGWADFSIPIPPYLMNELNIMLCKPYTLELYDSQGHVLGPVTMPEPYIEYADIQLIEENQSLNIEGTSRSITRKDKLPETVASLTLGDVPDAARPADRLGTLFKFQSGEVPTTRWFRPDANILAPNPTGKDVGKPLLDWLVESRARQLMYTALRFEGTLYGRLPYGIHTVLYFEGEGENDENGLFQYYPFVITRLISRLRMLEHDVVAISMRQKKAVPSGAGFTDKSYWQTPDGEIQINYDPASEQPVGPTLPEPVDPKDIILKQLRGILPDSPLRNGPFIPGFVAITAGDPQFGADVYVNGAKKASILSIARKTALFGTG